MKSKDENSNKTINVIKNAPKHAPKNAIQAESFVKIKQDLLVEQYELHNRDFIKNHLLVKHRQIQPSADQLDLINEVITTIERGLKAISDRLLLEELERLNLNQLEETKENHRHLKGVVRVGTIVKTLFLKSDRDMHLIVLTSGAPSYSLVRRIGNELESELLHKPATLDPLSTDLNTKPESSSTIKHKKIIYLLDKDESLIKTEAAFVVKCDFPDELANCLDENNFYKVKISFTATSLLSDNVEITDIDIKKCREALTEIQRVKWFNIRLKPIANAILILRIMRDLCQRSPTWSALSDWLLELIVDKCFVKNKYEDVTFKFRAVFECISSGIFYMPKLALTVAPRESQIMNDNHVLGFNDPVLGAESGNVFEAGLTPQQREELTVAAQNGLRLVAFQKIHELLGIDMIKQVAVDNRSNSPTNDRLKKCGPSPGTWGSFK